MAGNDDRAMHQLLAARGRQAPLRMSQTLKTAFIPRFNVSMFYAYYLRC